MKRLLSTLGTRLASNIKAPKPGATVPFQVLSDLHLEVGQQYNTFTFPTTAPNLILAGDIGLLADYDAYLDFVHHQTARYDRVFLVLGNHEFYGVSFATAQAAARRLESEGRLGGKLSFLQQNRVDLPGSVTVLGCTLWSRVLDDAKEVVSQKVNDFRRIEDWSVDDHNEAHESDLAWLKAELRKIGSDRSVLVVTHHAPSVLESSRPEHLKNPWTSAFATDVLSGEETWGSVGHWVFGHTHFSTEFEKRGVRVVSNQRGYVVPGVVTRKGVDEGFDPGRTIQVPVGRGEEVD